MTFDLVDSLGWLGTAMTISAYFLNLNGYFKATDRRYILLNFIGGILLVINTLAHAAFPAALENMVWAIMAFWAFFRGRKSVKLPHSDNP